MDQYSSSCGVSPPSPKNSPIADASKLSHIKKIVYINYNEYENILKCLLLYEFGKCEISKEKKFAISKLGSMLLYSINKMANLFLYTLKKLEISCGLSAMKSFDTLYGLHNK